eukprot:GHVU01209696.1.p2 GENE.GHVU01209696.1~~GHVU01209696.1.p2  ORF type:complete len:199 (+),score=33.12 GHVU01209696.1:1-597(+)
MARRMVKALRLEEYKTTGVLSSCPDEKKRSLEIQMEAEKIAAERQEQQRTGQLEFKKAQAEELATTRLLDGARIAGKQVLERREWVQDYRETHGRFPKDLAAFYKPRPDPAAESAASPPDQRGAKAGARASPRPTPPPRGLTRPAGVAKPGKGSKQPPVPEIDVRVARTGVNSGPPGGQETMGSSLLIGPKPRPPEPP